MIPPLPAVSDSGSRDPELSGGFRSAMRRLAAAVGIITAQGDEGPIGMAATSITSLTLDPPAIIVCVNRATSIHACLRAGAPLGVSILSRHQSEVSAAFGGAAPRERRFEFGNWTLDERDVLVLDEAQATLSCTVEQLVQYGTHSIVIARVDRVRLGDTVAPLIYQDGQYL